MTDLIASFDIETEAYLAIAGEGGVVKQEVGTKEEDNCIKHTQARPIEEDRPAEEGVLCYVPMIDRQKKFRKQFSKNSQGKYTDNIFFSSRTAPTFSFTSPVQGRLPLECLHGDMLLNQAVEEDGE